MKIFLIITFSILINYSYGQDIDYSKLKHLDSLGLIFNPPKFLKLNGSTDCYNDDPTLKKILTCQFNRFEIGGQECRIYYDIISYQSLVDPDNPFANNEDLSKTPNNLLQLLKLNIKAAYPNADSSMYDTLIVKYGKQETLTKFKAEEVYSYTLKIPGKSKFETQFSNLKMMIKQKNGRPLLATYILYSDKSSDFIEHNQLNIYQGIGYK
ncbi:hypothetical protein GCM10022216_08540 [Sphingobacterium kyonggiense]|uniref:Outer membrane lipoprotein-sorting protein n=1 Tax=Sphingobacterium kyonggiense TaxID=714075 RepID=A0ABP7YEM6_9SPHI